VFFFFQEFWLVQLNTSMGISSSRLGEDVMRSSAYLPLSSVTSSKSWFRPQVCCHLFWCIYIYIYVYIFWCWFLASRSIWNRGQACAKLCELCFLPTEESSSVCSRMNTRNRFDSTFMTLERATQCPGQCKGMSPTVQPSKKVREWHHYISKTDWKDLKKIMCGLVEDFKIG